MGCCGGSENDELEPHQKEGQKQELDEGPMKKRGCTDIICLLIFLAYVVGMMVILIMAVNQYGDPYRLLYGYDVKGDTCGTTNDKLNISTSSGSDLTSKPLLYIDIEKTAAKLFTSEKLASLQSEYNIQLDADIGDDPIYHCLNGVVNITLNSTATSSGSFNASSTKDVQNKILQFGSVDSILTGGDSCRYCVAQCPENYSPLFWRCIPNAVPKVAGATANTFFETSGAKSFFEQVIADVSASWKEIIYMCLVAFGLSVIVTILFRFLAGVIVWIIITIIALASILAPCIVWYLWWQKKKDFDLKSGTTNSTDTSTAEGIANAAATTYLSQDLTSADSEKEVTNWLVIAIVVTVVAVIILLILLVLRKRIKLVVQLFKEAGKAVHAMPLILLQPLWTLVALIALAATWTVAFAFIETAGYPAISSNGYIKYEKDAFWFWIRLFHIFGLLWLANFIIACQHVVIAGAVAGWYFARDKSSLRLPIASSFWRLVRYHMGSVAFGAFIIALVQLIRMIMQYVERKLSKKGGACGKALAPILKCCQCCLWCFEKCLKFLNRNAYIEVAIYGYNFCKAAQKAFSLLTSNILRVAAINSVGTFVLFLGKVAVVTSTVFIGAQIMQYQSDSNLLEVKYQWPAVVLAAIFAYMIIDCFIGVYGMAIDTIFLCFCEDSERNDGITRPYYMSKGLMEFVENSSKALAALKKRQEAAKGNQVQPMPVQDAMPQVA